MKIITLILLALFTLPSISQTTIIPPSQKDILIFENEIFTLKYPKDWRKTKRFISNRKPIFRISHKSVPQQKTFKIHFSVDSISTDFKNLQEFAEDRKQKLEAYQKKDSKVKRTMNTTKVNDNHFVESLRINKTDSSSCILTQFHLIHYHYRKGQIFSLTYSATPNYFDKFLSDAIYMLDSLEFKD